MSRKSKRPSPPKWTRPTGRKVLLTDELRRPFPGVGSLPAHRATYTITSLGHVFRDDGRLLAPLPAISKVQLNGSSVRRSVPHAVFLAFGRVRPPEGEHWDCWIPYGTPDDPMTGFRRCYVTDIVLVPHAEMCKLGSHGIHPKTRYKIV